MGGGGSRLGLLGHREGGGHYHGSNGSPQPPAGLLTRSLVLHPQWFEMKVRRSFLRGELAVVPGPEPGGSAAPAGRRRFHPVGFWFLSDLRRGREVDGRPDLAGPGGLLHLLVLLRGEDGCGRRLRR